MIKFTSAFFLILCSLRVISQSIPEGYILQYQQDFSDEKSLNDFRFNNPEIWNIKTENKNKFLHVTNDLPDSLKTSEFALIEKFIFGDFIFEADIMLPDWQKSEGASFFNIGIRDSAHYYSAVFKAALEGSNPDILITNGILPVKSVAEGDILNKVLTENKWHKIKIERNIVDRTIFIFIDEVKTPLLMTKDRTFVMGYIGFGAKNSGFKIDNIKIWSQTAITQPAGFFRKKI